MKKIFKKIWCRRGRRPTAVIGKPRGKRRSMSLGPAGAVSPSHSPSEAMKAIMAYNSWGSFQRVFVGVSCLGFPIRVILYQASKRFKTRTLSVLNSHTNLARQRVVYNKNLLYKFRSRQLPWDIDEKEKNKMRKFVLVAMVMILLAAMLHPARCEEMTEEQIASAREEALGKLDKPLEKMKIKELLALLSERGVECKDCNGAEKGEVVKQVVACACKVKLDACACAGAQR